MNTPTDEALAILACDIELRPAGAPSLEDLLGYVRNVRREESQLVVEYDSAARASLDAAVAAERLCCTEIGWDLEYEPGLRLHITASAPQLDLFEQYLSR